jgi:hypothetical protein
VSQPGLGLEDGVRLRLSRSLILSNSAGLTDFNPICAMRSHPMSSPLSIF